MATAHISSSMATMNLPKTLKNPNSISLPRNSLKLRLSSGDPLYGLSILSASPSLADIAALSGYDFLLLDSFSAAAAASINTPSVLRLPDLSPAAARAALALSPSALLFPSASPSSARAAAAACRHADSVAVIAEVDSVDQIYEIAETDGVDAVHVSAIGIAAGMGMLWDPGNRKVRERVMEAERRVLEVGKRNGCVLAGSAMPCDPPEGMKLRGYGMVVGPADVEMFRKAAVDDVARWRKAGTKEVVEEDGEEVEDEAYWKIM